MPDEHDGVRYELRDGIAWITLDRPERRNALTRHIMTTALPEAWARFSEDGDARVAVITGAGDQAFCAGMDLNEASETRYRASESGATPPEQRPVRVSPRMCEVWKPVIAAVNGVCTGVAIQLVTDCDIVVASDTAYFSDARVSVGLMPALGAAELTRVMPLHEALRLMFMGRHGRLTAERAYQIGFVNELVPPAELLPAAERVARTIMENAPLAVRLAKMAAWQGLDVGLAEAKTHARALNEAHPTAEDVREGARAFVEKRRPDWKLR